MADGKGIAEHAKVRRGCGRCFKASEFRPSMPSLPLLMSIKLVTGQDNMSRVQGNDSGQRKH